MSRKRRREQSSVDIQLVEIYDDLANESKDIRSKAIHAFLTKFSPQSNQSSEQLAEAVRRLIRGLCSGRKAARLGFSISLTELLFQRWGATPVNGAEQLRVSELIDILIKQTETTGKVDGQEERDHHFGRLFGAEAIIKSGVLFQSDASRNRVLDILFEIAKKKPWLREACGGILYGIPETLKSGHQNTQFVQVLIDKLCENGLAKSPEGVAIWLKVQTGFPDIDFPNGIWRSENPLNRKNLSKLAKILKEASTGGKANETNEGVSQSGNWNSRFHFVWNVIFTELTGRGSADCPSAKPETVGFGEFWQAAVDENLFAATSSQERKYWGFLLFQQLFDNAPEVFLPSLFTNNFKRCLINQLASKDRYLHIAAEKSIRSILKRVEQNPSSAFAALNAFLATSLKGRSSFDQLTKTKTVERLIALTDNRTACRLVDELCIKLVRPDTQDEEDAAASRQVIADQLVSLLKSRQSTDTQGDSVMDVERLVTNILNTFVSHSYFSVDSSVTDFQKAPLPCFSRKTQGLLRSRLFACLSHIVDKFPSPVQYAYEVVCKIRLNEADKDLHSNLNLTGSVNQSISTAWKIFESMARSREEEPGNSTSQEAFMLLYSFTFLQIYNGDADAVSMLDELRSCYDNLLNRDSEDRQQGSEILVELLLSLAGKPSQLFRRLTYQVFSAFASEINKNGLQSMIKVLETKENLAGQEEMFEQEIEDADEVSSNVSDVEEVQTEDVNGDQSASNGKEEHSSPSTEKSTTSTSSSSDQEEDEDELAAFDAKLAQALQTRPLHADPNAPTPTSSSSDEDMSDSQMEALDTQIATIFKERKNADADRSGKSKKKQQKDAKETIVNFKCRVLELLEIFVKQQHTKPVALELLMPLLQLTRTTTSQLVSGKACNLVREFSRLCKGSNKNNSKDAFQSVDDNGADRIILELLRTVHVEARREASNAHASACSQASLLLVRLLVGMDREYLREVVRVYAETMEALLMDPGCRVKMGFFTDWMNWCGTARLAR